MLSEVPSRAQVVRLVVRWQAKRDTAFVTDAVWTSGRPFTFPQQGGVALRFPPHYKRALRSGGTAFTMTADFFQQPDRQGMLGVWPAADTVSFTMRLRFPGGRCAGLNVKQQTSIT